MVSPEFSEPPSSNLPSNLTSPPGDRRPSGSPGTNAPRTNLEDKVLQELLADLVFGSGKQPDFTPLEEKIRQIEHQLYDPEEIIKLLLPVISELLNRKVAESKDSIIRAIVPIIDEVIVEKTQEDKVAMIQAIANLIPGAIDQQVRGNPEDLIEAIAPAMGEIIKQQIRIERDAMVDALYPVIGNTIAKYMQEVVQDINRRVESTLTPQGIRRKIRAKMQGVSEAELIFQESITFEIKAVFLIHKQSGLIISAVQKDQGDESLEKDLMAGMLTAMRGFASECIIEPGLTSELKEIEYENFQIMMEVAGYCYLATILKGEADKGYIKKLRRTLSDIILHYDRDRSIHDYSGDPRSVHPGIQGELEKLVHYQAERHEPSRRGVPWSLLVILSLLIGGWTGWSIFQRHQARQLAAVAEQINLELDVDPYLAVYPIQSEAKIVDGDRQLILTGKLPYPQLKEKAAALSQAQLDRLDGEHSWQLVNNIVTVAVPPDPEAIAAEVARLTTTLNQDDSILIQSQFDAQQQVTITGHLRNDTKLQQVIDAFSQIPAIQNILITATVRAFPIDQRLYFSSNAATLSPKDIQEKLPSIQEFLQQYPTLKIRIVGHLDPQEAQQSQNLAQQRAKAVHDTLVKAGIPPTQLEIQAAPSSPPNLTQADDPWLSRTVRFERIMERTNVN